MKSFQGKLFQLHVESLNGLQTACKVHQMIGLYNKALQMQAGAIPYFTRCKLVTCQCSQSLQQSMLKWFFPQLAGAKFGAELLTNVVYSYENITTNCKKSCNLYLDPMIHVGRLQSAVHFQRIACQYFLPA